MEGMKLVLVTGGRYDEYMVNGLYYVPIDCNADKVIAEAMDRNNMDGWDYDARKLIPSDWVEVKYTETHVETVYYREIGDKKARREKEKLEAVKYAGMDKQQIDEAKQKEKEEQQKAFIAKGGIMLTTESLFTDRTGGMLNRCRDIGAILASGKIDTAVKAICSSNE